MRTIMGTRPLIRRLSHAVLRRYPQAWRERYELEMTALIDDSTLGWSDVAELVRGMLEERAHELVQSDDRPKRTAIFLTALRRRMLLTFSELTALEARLRAARQFVDGCHDMIAKGVPSPLADAEAELDRVSRERDTARARLHALGYRARLRLPHETPPCALPRAADDLPQRPVP
jgi:hypothetical protein